MPRTSGRLKQKAEAKNKNKEMEMEMDKNIQEIGPAGANGATASASSCNNQGSDGFVMVPQQQAQVDASQSAVEPALAAPQIAGGSESYLLVNKQLPGEGVASASNGNDGMNGIQALTGVFTGMTMSNERTALANDPATAALSTGNQSAYDQAAAPGSQHQYYSGAEQNMAVDVAYQHGQARYPAPDDSDGDTIVQGDFVAGDEGTPSPPAGQTNPYLGPGSMQVLHSRQDANIDPALSGGEPYAGHQEVGNAGWNAPGMMNLQPQEVQPAPFQDAQGQYQQQLDNNPFAVALHRLGIMPGTLEHETFFGPKPWRIINQEFVTDYYAREIGPAPTPLLVTLIVETLDSLRGLGSIKFSHANFGPAPIAPHEQGGLNDEVWWWHHRINEIAIRLYAAESAFERARQADYYNGTQTPMPINHQVLSVVDKIVRADFKEWIQYHRLPEYLLEPGSMAQQNARL